MIEIVLADYCWEDVEPDTEALLEKWLVEAGERVSAGQALANVVLVKTSIEIEAPAAGTITEIRVAEDDSFGRGAVLALLAEP